MSTPAKAAEFMERLQDLSEETGVSLVVVGYDGELGLRPYEPNAYDYIPVPETYAEMHEYEWCWAPENELKAAERRVDELRRAFVVSKSGVSVTESKR